MLRGVNEWLDVVCRRWGCADHSQDGRAGRACRQLWELGGGVATGEIAGWADVLWKGEVHGVASRTGPREIPEMWPWYPCVPGDGPDGIKPE